MMMAKFRSRCSWAMAWAMKGNFWTVVMMILLPSVMSLLEVCGTLSVSHGGASPG